MSERTLSNNELDKVTAKMVSAIDYRDFKVAIAIVASNEFSNAEIRTVNSSIAVEAVTSALKQTLTMCKECYSPDQYRNIVMNTMMALQEHTEALIPLEVKEAILGEDDDEDEVEEEITRH